MLYIAFGLLIIQLIPLCGLLLEQLNAGEHGTASIISAIMFLLAFLPVLFIPQV